MLVQQAVHAGKPSNVAEIKEFCKECERLIAS